VSEKLQIVNDVVVFTHGSRNSVDIRSKVKVTRSRDAQTRDGANKGRTDVKRGKITTIFYVLNADSGR